MSRYAQSYHDAGQMPLVCPKLQYESMMHNKKDIMDLGARLLSEYRARRRDF
jgi:hypothetical protein